MLQPTQYDAVLGGRSTQPDISTAAVLGGKNSVDMALKALDNPKYYEQAKQVLLAQPKTTPSTVIIKTRSWQGILEFYSCHIEVVKELGIPSEDYTSVYAEYRFDTPTTTDNRLIYTKTKEGITWEIGHRACLRSEKWLCNQFSQAFNFRYGGRSIYNYTPISHYWDDRRLKMILLP